MAAGDPALADGMRHIERAVEHDVGDRVEAVRREVLGRADEIAGGVVDQAGQRSAFVPDALRHRIDRSGISNVDRMSAHDAAMACNQLPGGVVQHAAAPAAEPELRAQLEVAGGDLLAEACAAAGNEDALTLEQTFLEHGRSVASTAKRPF